jgi:predicted phage terminase large subunit-like protein
MSPRAQRKDGDWDAEFAGSLYKREWLSKIVEAVPVDAERVRFWDLASISGGGDYTVGAKVSLDEDGRICIEDIVRGQWGPHAVEKILKATADMDGVETSIEIEQEPGSSGKTVIENYIRLLGGYDVRGRPASGSKVSRWKPFVAQAEAGNVSMLSAPWNSDLIDELCGVPNTKHDDQADAVAGAYNRLASEPQRVFGISFLR